MMKLRTAKQLKSSNMKQLSTTKKHSASVLKAALLALPLWLSCQTSAYADEWKVNLQDADIRAFINEVANITDKNFSIDPRVNGNVTVISNNPMNEEEIYQLFLSVMEVNGVTAVQRDDVTILKPDNVAKQSGLPVDLNSQISGQQMVTRVIYLQNTQANEVLGVIRPLMPSSAHAAPVSSVNALVLSDKASSLDKLETLIGALDSGADNRLEIVNLRHSNAERMMELIAELTVKGGGTPGAQQLRIIADNASNRLLISGNREKIATIKSMINRLDTLPEKSQSSMKIFKLNYSEASHVSNIVRALIANQSINSSEATTNVSTASLNNSGKSKKPGKGKTSSINSGSPSKTMRASRGKTGSQGDTDRAGHPFSIIADESRNAIYVNASSQTIAEIEEFIKNIDIPDVQILIQAAVIEVSGDDMEQLGVQWALGSNNAGYGLINFDNVGSSAANLATAALSKAPAAISSATSSIAGALLGIGNSKTSVDANGNSTSKFYGAILQAIDKTSSANLLSTPSITTLNHKEASLLVGQNVPFVTGSFSNTGGNASPFQTVDRQDVGIQLNVMPHVGPDGVVKLEVSQEVSSVVEGSTSNVSGLITNKSFIDTTVMAKSGQTIALGGLMREKNSQSQQKIPKLGDAPIIGRLFRSDDESTQKSNLIIFLQPTVLKNGGVAPSITERDGDNIKVMQLSIEANGTIRQHPLTAKTGWHAKPVDFSKSEGVMPVSPWSNTEQDFSSLITNTITKKNTVTKPKEVAPTKTVSFETKKQTIDNPLSDARNATNSEHSTILPKKKIN